MESTKSLIDEVEDFILNIDISNVIVTDKAHDIMASRTGQDRFGRETKKELGFLNALLGAKIADYKINRHIPALRLELARECLVYIELARTNNVLEYPNLSAKAKKFDELEKEHETLKDKFVKLQKYNNELIKENEKLKEDNRILHGFDKNRKGSGSEFSGGLDKIDS